MTDHEKLCTAISIVQQHILALDSNLDAEFLFKTRNMPTPALELAVNLMADTLDRLEDH